MEQLLHNGHLIWREFFSQYIDQSTVTFVSSCLQFSTTRQRERNQRLIDAVQAVVDIPYLPQAGQALQFILTKLYVGSLSPHQCYTESNTCKFLLTGCNLLATVASWSDGQLEALNVLLYRDVWSLVLHAETPMHMPTKCSLSAHFTSSRQLEALISSTPWCWVFR